MLFNMIVSYNGGDFLNLIDQTTNFDISSAPNFSQIALTMTLKDGFLEFLGALT